MRLDYKSPESLAPVIEALVFASDEPLSATALRALILGEEVLKTSIDEPAETPESSAGETQDTGAATASVAVSEATEGTEVSASEPEKQPADDAAQDEIVSHAAEQPTNGHAEGVAQDTEDASETVAAGPAEESATSDDASVAAVEAQAEARAGAEAPAGVAGPVEKKRKKRQLIELVTIHVAVQHLNSLYEQQERSFRIIEIAGGYQFATRPEYSEYVVRLSKEKSRRRLSGASLESLAIIAYKQPVSKTDIENIRGVNCDEVLKSLLEKNLITITGRADAVGRPLLYGTTTEFLRHFGLHSLSDLPRPREIEELMKEESVKATTLEEAATEFVSAQEDTEEITVDAAIAVARELAEREEEVLEDEDLGGIELDVEAMQSINPGHPGEHLSPPEIEDEEETNERSDDEDEEYVELEEDEIEALENEEMDLLHEETIESATDEHEPYEGDAMAGE